MLNDINEKIEYVSKEQEIIRNDHIYLKNNENNF